MVDRDKLDRIWLERLLTWINYEGNLNCFCLTAFRTDTTEILGLTTRFETIAQLWAFSTYITNESNDFDRFKSIK
jgi:hypothetical protein